jgi:hypothetical protein
MDNMNEDWIKTLRWDLGFTSLDGLLSYLSVTGATADQQWDAITSFMALPAWEAAPIDLVAEVSAWLAAHQVEQ